MAPQYQCVHVVEAMPWVDTTETREQFADWFEEHGEVFETDGHEIVFSFGDRVAEGWWVVRSDNEFMAMPDELFHENYRPRTGGT